MPPADRPGTPRIRRPALPVPGRLPQALRLHPHPGRVAAAPPAGMRPGAGLQPANVLLRRSGERQGMVSLCPAETKSATINIIYDFNTELRRVTAKGPFSILSFMKPFLFGDAVAL